MSYVSKGQKITATRENIQQKQIDDLQRLVKNKYNYEGFVYGDFNSEKSPALYIYASQDVNDPGNIYNVYVNSNNHLNRLVEYNGEWLSCQFLENTSGDKNLDFDLGTSYYSFLRKADFCSEQQLDLLIFGEQISSDVSSDISSDIEFENVRYTFDKEEFIPTDCKVIKSIPVAFINNDEYKLRQHTAGPLIIGGAGGSVASVDINTDSEYLSKKHDDILNINGSILKKNYDDNEYLQLLNFPSNIISSNTEINSDISDRREVSSISQYLSLPVGIQRDKLSDEIYLDFIDPLSVFIPNDINAVEDKRYYLPKKTYANQGLVIGNPGWPEDKNLSGLYFPFPDKIEQQVDETQNLIEWPRIAQYDEAEDNKIKFTTLSSWNYSVNGLFEYSELCSSGENACLLNISIDKDKHLINLEPKSFLLNDIPIFADISGYNGISVGIDGHTINLSGSSGSAINLCEGNGICITEIDGNTVISNAGVVRLNHSFGDINIETACEKTLTVKTENKVISLEAKWPEINGYKVNDIPEFVTLSSITPKYLNLINDIENHLVSLSVGIPCVEFPDPITVSQDEGIIVTKNDNDYKIKNDGVLTTNTLKGNILLESACDENLVITQGDKNNIIFEVKPQDIPNVCVTAGVGIDVTKDGDNYTIANNGVISLNDFSSAVTIVSECDKTLTVSNENNTIKLNVLKQGDDYSVNNITEKVTLESSNSNLTITPDVSNKKINFDVTIPEYKEICIESGDLGIFVDKTDNKYTIYNTGVLTVNDIAGDIKIKSLCDKTLTVGKSRLGEITLEAKWPNVPNFCVSAGNGINVSKSNNNYTVENDGVISLNSQKGDISLISLCDKTLTIGKDVSGNITFETKIPEIKTFCVTAGDSINVTKDGNNYTVENNGVTELNCIRGVITMHSTDNTLLDILNVEGGLGKPCIIFCIKPYPCFKVNEITEKVTLESKNSNLTITPDVSNKKIEFDLTLPDVKDICIEAGDKYTEIKHEGDIYTIYNKGVNSLNELTGTVGITSNCTGLLEVGKNGNDIVLMPKPTENTYSVNLIRNYVDIVSNCTKLLEIESNTDNHKITLKPKPTEIPNFCVSAGIGISVWKPNGSYDFTVTNKGVTKLNKLTGDITIKSMDENTLCVKVVGSEIQLKATGGGGGGGTQYAIGAPEIVKDTSVSWNKYWEVYYFGTITLGDNGLPVKNGFVKLNPPVVAYCVDVVTHTREHTEGVL